MPTVSLTSFLKILTKGTPQKVQEYSKYLTPGGYDFYWQLKAAATNLTVGGQPFDQCVQPINQIKREVERKHNFEGLKALNKWIAGRGTNLKFFKPPQVKCSSPKGLLQVRLEPEFGLIEHEKRQMILLWNSKAADLKAVVAGLAFILCNSISPSENFLTVRARFWICESAGCLLATICLRQFQQ